MLGDAYATTSELENRLHGEGEVNLSVAFDTDELQAALDTASSGINGVCGRQFNKTTTASPRRFYPDTCGRVEVADFHTTTGLIIETDTADDGSFATVWDAADYELMPLDGIVDDEPGWPYNEIIAMGAREFSLTARRASVRVTAQWGWASIPDPVHTACLIAAVEIWKLKDTPFGVAGTSEWGTIRVRENPFVMKMLNRYIRTQVLVA